MKTLKGNTNYEIIKFRQDAALIENKEIISGKDFHIHENIQILEKGRKYLLFLKIFGQGEYSAVSTNQGIYAVDDLPATDELAKIVKDKYQKNNQLDRELEKSFWKNIVPTLILLKTEK